MGLAERPGNPVFPIQVRVVATRRRQAEDIGAPAVEGRQVAPRGIPSWWRHVRQAELLQGAREAMQGVHLR